MLDLIDDFRLILNLPAINFCCLAGLVSMEDADPDFLSITAAKSYPGSRMQATARARISWFESEVGGGR